MERLNKLFLLHLSMLKIQGMTCKWTERYLSVAFLSPKEVILNHFHNPVKWILMTTCVLVLSRHVAACGIAAVLSRDNPQHQQHSGSPRSLTDPGQLAKEALWRNLHPLLGFPGGASGKKPTCQCRRCGFNPWLGKIPWRRAWQITLVFLPGDSHRQRSLADYSPWGHKESDMT